MGWCCTACVQANRSSINTANSARIKWKLSPFALVLCVCVFVCSLLVRLVNVIVNSVYVLNLQVCLMTVLCSVNCSARSCSHWRCTTDLTFETFNDTEFANHSMHGCDDKGTELTWLHYTQYATDQFVIMLARSLHPNRLILAWTPVALAWWPVFGFGWQTVQIKFAN